ncbi:hypothetical protein [Lysinibacillus sp. G4S2]|uniref:hypothetical protein n=1 Tax=Lysinibacillus sp. G4S2 TaxID=3055859 RepID=UPI0025A2EFF2|nr:hypothetical protein [Lysinibacillus sp. G4S2]MDM5247622.1 hypothetical protein [Lysinibacillus sp. G4S2]
MGLNSIAKNNIEDIQLEELTFLKEQFNLYKKLYNQLKANYEKQELQWEWSKGGFYYNFTPFEIERSGYKKGKLLKKEPKNKDQIIEYGKLENGIVNTKFYSNDEYIYSEKFILKEGNSLIEIRYSDGIEIKSLDKISILFFNDEGHPQKYITYEHEIDCEEEDNEEEYTIAKELYEYKDLKIIKISVRGYIKDSTKRIVIDRDYNIVYDLSDNLSEIFSQDNNLASGKQSNTKIFSELE